MTGNFCVPGDTAMNDVAWNFTSLTALPFFTSSPSNFLQPDTFLAFPHDSSDIGLQWGQDETMMASHSSREDQELLMLAAQTTHVPGYQRIVPAATSRNIPNLNHAPRTKTNAVKTAVMHSKEEWENKKHVIKRLWITENRTWKCVEETLRIDFSFPVTRRQFTRKTEQWGFAKKIKEKEMRLIDVIERERVESLGKKTNFQIGGRIYRPENLQRWRKRHDGHVETKEQDFVISRTAVSISASLKTEVMDMDISYQTPKESSSVPSPNFMSNFNNMVSSHQLQDFPGARDESAVNHVEYQPESHDPTSALHFSSESGVTVHEVGGENLSHVVKEKSSLDVESLGILDSPKLSRLLAALRLHTTEEIPSISLNDADDTTEKDHHEFQYETTDEISRSPKSSTMMILRPQASLSPFRRLEAVVIKLRPREIRGTLEWCHSEEFKWKATLFRLKSRNVALQERFYAMSNLARVFLYQYKYKDAERIFRHVAVQSAKIYGNKHPKTIIAYYEATRCILQQGKFVQAEKINRRLQIISKQAVGSDQMLRRTLLYLEAVINLRSIKLRESIGQYRQLIQMIMTTDGFTNSELSTYLISLGVVQNKMYLDSDCEETFRTILDLQRLPGFEVSKHNEYLILRNLAQSFVTRSRYEQAESLLRNILEESKRIFGPEHKVSLQTLCDLAWTLNCQRKYEQAKAIIEPVLDLRMRLLGVLHPDTLDVKDLVADVCYGLKMWEDAVHYYLQLVEGYGKTIGHEHLYTLQSCHRLGMAYCQLELYESSLQWLRRAEAGLRKFYGEGHERVKSTEDWIDWVTKKIEGHSE